MAAAMARGWSRAAHGPDLMLFTDAGSGRAAELAAELGGERCSSLTELARRVDLTVLAVKPKALATVGPQLEGAGLVVSVLGATRLEDLRTVMPGEKVIRVMPNVAVEIGRGVICHAPTDSDAETGAALALLAELGTTVELREQQLDAATAVMGCGPAYLALAAGSIADAGVEAGLDPGLARSLIADTAAGVGALLRTRDAEELQRAVASPGGSTEAGLETLGAREVGPAFAAAVAASLQRMAGAR